MKRAVILSFVAYVAFLVGIIAVTRWMSGLEIECSDMVAAALWSLPPTLLFGSSLYWRHRRAKALS